ncbi:MAG: hypothetical protein QW291_06130 [Thermofilaceae archaeon]
MLSESKALPSLVESRRVTLEILDGNGIRLVTTSVATEPFLCAVSNALVGNSLSNEVIEVEGELVFRCGAPVLAAVAGQSTVQIGERFYKPWRALPIPPNKVVKVVTQGGLVYVALKGLKMLDTTGKNNAIATACEFTHTPDLQARYIPEKFLHEYLKSLDNTTMLEGLLTKVLRHLKLACEMASKGAKLVKVRIGTNFYEVWVNEIR